jgi:hypothetical protein
VEIVNGKVVRTGTNLPPLPKLRNEIILETNSFIGQDVVSRGTPTSSKIWG